MLKISLLFKKLHRHMTQQFLGLRMRNFQGIAFIHNEHILRFSNLHKCTFNDSPTQLSHMLQ